LTPVQDDELENLDMFKATAAAKAAVGKVRQRRLGRGKAVAEPLYSGQ
jgi:hypothetical protein